MDLCMGSEEQMMFIFGSKRLYVRHILQKDPGFDRGQFYKQAAVMRGQVSCFFNLLLFWLSTLCLIEDSYHTDAESSLDLKDSSKIHLQAAQ